MKHEWAGNARFGHDYFVQSPEAVIIDGTHAEGIPSIGPADGPV